MCSYNMFPPCRGAAATPVNGEQAMSNIGSLSVMLLFAIVLAAVSIYTQRTVAELYRPRTVAETNTLIFKIGSRASSVTQLTVMILFKAESAKTDFE